MMRHLKSWQRKQILAAKRAGDEATAKELEARIDRHGFRLYGLTPQEIALVEGAIPSTSTKSR